MRHSLALRPRFGELDPYNHVNHSVYVAWFEAGRCEALETIGLALHTMAERGFQIVVVDLHVRYLRPARAGEDLVVETWVSEHRGITSTWSQRLVRPSGPEVLCEATVRAGICDLSGRPTKAGASLCAELAALA